MLQEVSSVAGGRSRAHEPQELCDAATAVFNTDQGAQFTAHGFTATLETVLKFLFLFLTRKKAPRHEGVSPYEKAPYDSLSTHA